MVICLERDADLHMTQRMPLPLTVSCFSKIQIGLPFWYRLTRVVPDKGPLNGCVIGTVCNAFCLLVRLSVPAWAHSGKPAAAGLLLWARPAGDIDRLLRGRRSAATTGSASLSADVGS